jgi:hypothetical protein
MAALGFVLAALACEDATLPVGPDPDPTSAAAPATEVRAALLQLDDAAGRVLPALQDRALADALHAPVTRLHDALIRADGDAFVRALSAARAALQGSTYGESGSDAADRDVITFALDATARLAPGPASRF